MLIDPSLRQALTRLAPSSLIDRLDSADEQASSALNDMIQHLNSLRKAIASFLPLYLTEDEHLLGTHYRAQRLGTFMFADVSGFTALSERLHQQNSGEGEENLTLIMNRFFARMLEILANCDGMLIKFAGDALLAFFPADDTTHDAGRAVRTAIRMQRAMAIFQPISDSALRDLIGGEPMSLTMSIGLARGSLFEALVGNTIQREHMIQGTLPYLAMEAEAVGVRDDIIIESSLASILKGQFTLQPLTGGFLQVIDDLTDSLGDYEVIPVRRRRAKDSAIFLERSSLEDHLRRQVEKLQVVARYVSPRVLHELVSGGSYHVRSENRTTTIIFVYASGFSELLDEWGAQHLDQIGMLMERYYNLIHQIVTATGGIVTRTDPYQRGMKLLITYGVLVSHEDDPARAAEAALSMTRSLEHFNARSREDLPPGVSYVPKLEQCISITQGRTFSGEVGWKARREYTVMGDDVNLAARLMAKGRPGQILVSERVQRRIDSNFEMRAAGEQRLKGKSHPVPIYALIGEKPAATPVEDSRPLIGHDLIVHALTLTLTKTAHAQQRHAAALIGEIGTGKTQIARALVREARALGFQAIWATCTPRASRRSTWNALVSDLLGIDEQAPLEKQRAHLKHQVEQLNLLDIEAALAILCFSDVGEERFAGLEAEYTPPPDQFQIDEPAADTQRPFGIFKRAQTELEKRTQPERSSRNLWLRMQRRVSTMEAVARLLNRMAAETPLLLVIDGLEHENRNALAILQHVLEDTAAARIMIILTWSLPADFVLPVERITIPDLGREEMRVFAMEQLHVRELGDRLSRALWERTSGRPLFIESFLHYLNEGGYLLRDAYHADITPDARLDGLPDNIRELMISRFDRLPAHVQTLLRTASIFNGEFSEDMLSVVIAASGEGSDLVLAEALAQSVVALILKQTHPGKYWFRNLTMQTAIYENLPRMQRLRLHRAAARYWRNQPTSEEQVIALAYQLGKCGLLPEALEVITHAADHAVEQEDVDSAIELYAYALSVFPDEKSIRLRLERLRAGKAE